MSLQSFLEKIKNNSPVSFDETLAVITEHYHYQPTMFSNGPAGNEVINAAGTNEGSCKIFAFAKQNQLNEQETLSLFGDYYRLDVLGNPQGAGHLNIRHFMEYGWAGIRFDGAVLTIR
jgi:hypothetical protein